MRREICEAKHVPIHRIQGKIIMREDQEKESSRRYRSARQEVDLQEDLREMEQEEREMEREYAARKKRQAERRRREQQRKKRQQRGIAAAVGVLVVVVIAGLGINAVSSRSSGAVESGLQADTGGENGSALAAVSTDGESVVSGSQDAGAMAAAVTEENRTVSLAAVGDNLISQRMLDQALTRGNGSYDFTYVYANVTDYLQTHEINWIDVETCINDAITPEGYPTFSTPGQNGLDLDAAGFNVFSLANNHTYDLYAEGISAEVDFFDTKMPEDAVVTGLWTIDDSAGTSFTADYSASGYAEQSEVDYDDIPIYTCENGKTIAFLTYAEMSNVREDGLNSYTVPEGSDHRIIFLYEEDLIKAQIEKADELADAVVVACHWGDEDTHEINDTQKYYAQFLADCGADLIIGGHPHVLQDAEWIAAADGRTVFCAYSLGNFVSTQEEVDNLIGAALDCELKFATEEELTAGAPEVTIQNPTLVPMVMDYGDDAADAHVVLLSNYTEEQAEAHGINTLLGDGSMTLDIIQEIVNSSVSSDYLTNE